MSDQWPRDIHVRIKKQFEDLVRQTSIPGFMGKISASTWTRLASTFLDAAIAQDPSKLASGGLDVLLALIGVEDEQTALLKSISRQVTLLREGPFRAGRLQLREAARIGHDQTRAKAFLEEARQCFYTAYGLIDSPTERGLVEIHIGLVWWLLGNDDDARYWVAAAYRTCTDLLGGLEKEAADTVVVKRKSTVAAVTVFYPAGIGVMAIKAWKVKRSERALRSIGHLMPVINMLAASGSALGEPGLSSFTFERKDDRWLISPIEFQ